MEPKINIIGKFAEWLTHEGKATATIASYVNDVNQFNQYLALKGVDPEVLLSRFLFTNYMNQLEAEDMVVSTINKKVNSLKVYNDWHYRKKMVEDVIISIRKDKVKIAFGSEAEVSVLTDVQVEQFLFHLEKERQRNKLIGYLLLYTGI